MIELPTPEQLERACRAMPVFPLPGVVFLPHTLLPLHVFEDRYRELVEYALANDSLMGVPQLEPGWEADYRGRPGLIPSMGIGRIVRHQRLDDGRYNIILLGLARARIVAEPPGATSFRLVQAVLRPDRDTGGVAQAQASSGRLRLLLAQAASQSPSAAKELGRLIEPGRDPAELVDMVAHIVLQDPRSRQDYLETDELVSRFETVIAALATKVPTTNAADA